MLLLTLNNNQTTKERGPGTKSLQKNKRALLKSKNRNQNSKAINIESYHKNWRKRYNNCKQIIKQLSKTAKLK